jgi:hypothetical protein
MARYQSACHCNGYPRLPLKISNSEVQVFKDCRRKWYLAFYRELALKQPSQVGPLKLGTKIHIALEALYAHDENPMTVLNELYEEDAQKVPDDTELRKEQSLAQAMIEGFMEWREEQGIDAGLKVVATESVVEVPLTGVPNVILRGKLDQRVERQVDGARMFRDWKTTASIDSSQMTLQMDEQMKFYHLLEYLEAMEITGEEPKWRTDGALYTMLRKVKRMATAKPPFYAQIEVHHNKEELRSIFMGVTRVCRDIIAAYELLDRGDDHRGVVPPRPSRDCTWKCQFFTFCSMLDDGSNPEGLIAEYYEIADPHERYAEVKGETTE